MDRRHNEFKQRVLASVNHYNTQAFPQLIILELILLCTNPPKQAHKLSCYLLDRFATLAGVINAPLELLCEVKGLNKDTALFIKFIYYVIQNYYDSIYSRSYAIIDVETAKKYITNKFLSTSSEAFYFVGLGNNGRILRYQKITEGSSDMTNISPSSISKAALKADASKVVLAHTRPYDFCEPSQSEISSTYAIKTELLHYEIELFDHIIVTPDGVYSMREKGLL